jgi:DUF438 domain-containing protein
MTELEMLKGILDSYPYPIVFVDNDYIIRFLNKRARYHYYEERGYQDLIGKCIFDCHDHPTSEEMIRKTYEGIKRNGKEVFLKVNVRNERIYMQGVRNDAGQWIGFFERFEQNCVR